MLKVGDSIVLKPGLKSGLQTGGGSIWDQMLHPSQPVTVRDIDKCHGCDCIGSDGYRYRWEWLDPQDPIEVARRAVATAEEALEAAKQALADVLDSPVVVGQKRKNPDTSSIHEILFVHEDHVMTRYTVNGLMGYSTQAVSRARGWPLVP